MLHERPSGPARRDAHCADSASQASGAVDQRPRAPFPVDVQKLRAAFAWLREFNVWRQDAHWDEEAAAAWRDETEDLPVQEEELDAHQQLSRGTFLAWTQTSQAAEEADSSGFAIGRALRGELSARLDQSHSVSGSLSEARAECRLWGGFYERQQKPVSVLRFEQELLSARWSLQQ